MWPLALLILLAGAPARAQAGDMKFRAYLLWGTDDLKPPAGKTYKHTDAEISAELKKLPLKWTNWFEVNRKEFTAPRGGTKRTAVSEKCELEVRNLGEANVEVVLYGKGKEVLRRKQSLERGRFLNLGGNAPNATAWLVVIKRLQ